MMYKLNDIIFNKYNLPYNLKDFNINLKSLKKIFLFPSIDERKYFPASIIKISENEFKLKHLQIISAITYWEEDDTFDEFKRYLENGIYNTSGKYNSYIKEEDPFNKPKLLKNMPFLTPSRKSETKGDSYVLNIRYAHHNHSRLITPTTTPIHKLFGADKVDIDGIIIFKKGLDKDERYYRKQYYNNILKNATRIKFIE
jgi:hypothetical protein